MELKHITVAALLVTALLTPGISPAATKCTMRFQLSGWSAFYKTAHGSGTITCDNRHSANVALHVTGGGLTFGKTKIVNGKGTFSDVESMSELYGSYATADVHAGMVKSSDAQVLTKGPVSLALAGTGEGVDIGFDFGKFTIKRPARK
jgi:hypothetical protein